MIIDGNRITMTGSELAEFTSATFAPWPPRTIAEFQAMCDLGAARHLADNIDGVGFMHALAVEEMKFGPDGAVNFPMDKRKMEYMRLHGTWPSEQQFKDFEGAAEPPGAVKLSVVRGNS